MVAHIEHYKLADVKRIGIEFCREPGYNNSDGRVDVTKTVNNYQMRKRSGRRMGKRTIGGGSDALYRRVCSRLNDTPHAKRKDLNVMSCWVITCPEALRGDREHDFFSFAYEFLQNRYGMENVLEGYVHKDECSPHMHVPVFPTKDGRVSAKALFDKTELQAFHTDLDKACEMRFGIKGLVRNGRTKGNYTVSELKARTKHEKVLEAREAALEAREAALKAREYQVAQEAIRASQAIQEAQEAIQAAKAMYKTLQAGREEQAVAFATVRGWIVEQHKTPPKTVQVAAQTIKSSHRDLDADYRAWVHKAVTQLSASGYSSGFGLSGSDKDSLEF